MKGQRLRAIALDFDLTIFDYTDPPAIKSLAPWFPRLHRDGIVCGIASGRSHQSLQQEFTAVGMPWGPEFPDFIIEHECLLLNPDGSEMVGACEWNNRIRQEAEFLERHARPILERVGMEAEKAGIPIVRPIQIEPGNATLCLDSPAAAERARRALAADPCVIEHQLEVRRNHHILILALADRNKGCALREWCRLSEIDPQEVLSIGDNLNDLPMMRGEIGFQCATVANADPLVREYVHSRGGMVARRAIADGVADLFEAVLRMGDLLNSSAFQADATLSSIG